MDQTFNYNPFITMIYGEIALIVLVVAITYALFFYYKLQRQHRTKITQQLSHYLLNDGPVQPNEPRWKNLACAVSSMHDVTESKRHLCAPRVEQVVQEILCPLAQQAAYQRFWYQRYLAAKAFTYGATSDDEATLLHLLGDSHPSVAMEASRAIRHAPTARLMNALIDKIAMYERKNYDFYLEVFRRLPLSTRDTLLERLGYERRHAEKALCYKLLMRYPADMVYAPAQQDLQSQDLEVAVAALKYLFYADSSLSPDVVRQLLEDPRRDIKILTLAAIAKRQWATLIDAVVPLLEDADSLVRLSAAKCLGWIGDKGVKRLRARLTAGDSLAHAEIDAVLAAMTHTTG